MMADQLQQQNALSAEMQRYIEQADLVLRDFESHSARNSGQDGTQKEEVDDTTQQQP